MFSRKITYNKPYNQQNLLLTKNKSSYDKLEKEMKKPPSGYDEIKALVETENNSITNIQNNINNSKIIVSTSTHQKKTKMKK